MRVETARGAMAVDGLGTTLMHEHIFVLTPDVEWILRAVGQTHVETGTPITVHTSAALKTGLIVQRIPQRGGRRPDEDRIGHCGDTTDLDYLREIANAGSLLGMDRFGIDVFLPFEDRITTVAALAKAGYADWMVLAHDASCYSDFYGESYKSALLPRWNYTHIADDVLPALREHGVDEAQITAMLVHNPARYFTGGQE
jgi:phosphotriesterase-related protein